MPVHERQASSNRPAPPAIGAKAGARGACPFFPHLLLLLTASPPTRPPKPQSQVRGTPTPPISELVTVEQRPEKLKLPAGYHWYETMLVLQPLLSDEDR